MDRFLDRKQSSRRSSPNSRSYSYSRERYNSPEESKHSRHRRKSSRVRSRSRDSRRDNDCRSASKDRRRFSSKSRSNSPYGSDRQSDSDRRRSGDLRVRDRTAKTVPAELKLLTHDASYFLLKSNNFDNLLLAKAESVWSTPPQNEVRINNAFKVCKYSPHSVSV